MLMALAEFEFTVAAMKAVMVVPMLAPKMKGAAFLIDTIFFATNGTTTDVVMVEDRMAAVVVTPQKNAFNRFLKNKLLNRSGDPVSNNPEINFLKSRMEINTSANARMASINPFGIISEKKSIRILNPDHVGEKVVSCEVANGV